MANNTVYLHLGLNSSEFNSKLKKAAGDLDLFTKKGYSAAVKADLQFPNAKQLQDELAKAWKGLKGVTIEGKGGARVPVETLQQVEKEYANLEKRQAKNIQLTKQETAAYEKLKRVMNATMAFGNAKYEYDTMQRRMAAATNTGKVAAERRRSYNAEFAEEKAKRKEQSNYNKRAQTEISSIYQDKERDNAALTKAEQESERTQQQLRAAESKRAYNEAIRQQQTTQALHNARVQYVRDYYAEQDKNANAFKKGANSSPELAAMRQYYTQQAKDALREQTATDGLTESKRRLTDAERQYQNALKANKKGNNLQQINAEISALNKLINAKRHDLRVTTGRRGQTDSELDGYRERMRVLEQQRSRVQEANNVLREQGRIFSHLSSALLKYINIFALINFGKKIAETTGYFEKQRVALEGITGSAAKANHVLREIMDFALKSPFQTKELVDFTKKLSAFSIPVDELFDTTKKLADLSAGLGVDMNRIVLAYGQVRSASVLRGQELRQFTEAGIPMVSALAKKFSELNGELVTTSDIFEMISKRQVSFEMVDSVLTDMTSEGGKFYKMQENIAGTLYGQIQKLKDLWTISLNDIGKNNGGVLSGVVKALQWGVVHAKSLGHALVVAFSATMLHGAIRAFREISMLIKTASFSAKAMGGWISAAVGVLTFVISSLVSKTNRLESQLADIATSYEKENKRMADGLDSLLNRMYSATRGTKAFNDALETLKSNYGEFLNLHDPVITGLDAEGKAVLVTKEHYDALASSMKEAIKAKNKYLEIKETEELLKENVAGNLTDFWKRITSGGKARSGIRKFLEDNYNNQLFVGEFNTGTGKTPFSNSKLRGLLGRQYTDQSGYIINSQFSADLEMVQKDALAEFMTSYEESESQFVERFKTAFDQEFRGNKMPKELVEELAKDIFNSIKGTDDFKAYLNYLPKLRATDNTDLSKRRRIDFAFSQFNPNEYRPGKDGTTAVDALNWKNGKYVGILNKVLTDEFKGILTDETGGKNELADALFVISKSGTISEITEALDALEKAITDESLKSILSQAITSFTSATHTMTEHEEYIANNIQSQWGNAPIEQYGKVTFNPIEFANKYTPALWNGDKTIEQVRDEIAKEMKEYEEEIKSYRSKNAQYYKDEIKLRERRLEILKKLSEPEFYNVLPDQKGSGNGNKYSRIRIVNFFDDITKYILEADKQLRNVVQVTGINPTVNDFVSSLSDDNILKKFFEQGGKPFAEFFSKLEEYGVTEFLPDGFDAQSIENIFKSVGWKEGEEMSLPDFKAMYNLVLDNIGKEVMANLNKRRLSYATGTSERNSLDAAYKSMEESLTRMIKTGDAHFNGEEIAEKIESAIKELAKIRSGVDKIQTTRNAFEKLSQNYDYRDVWKALYGGGKYSTAKPDDEMRKALQQALNTTPGKGIMSVFGDGFNKLLNVEQLDISHLNTIYELINSISDLEGIDGVAKDQFSKIKKDFIDLLKQLANKVVEVAQKESERFTSDERTAVVISRSVHSYTDRMNAIEKYKDNKKEKANYERRVIDATVDLFKDITSKLGGSVNEQLKYLFGNKNSATGLNKTGELFAAFESLNKGGVSSLIGNIVGQRVALGEKNLANGINVRANGGMSAEAASEFMGKFNATLTLVDTIIKAVYNSIKAITEMGNKIIDWLEKTNDVVGINRDYGGSNGRNKYWNPNKRTYETRFDENNLKVARESLQIIQTFNQHVMDGWEKLKSGDVLGAVFETISSIGDLIVDIMGTSDTSREGKIQQLLKDAKELDRVIDMIDWQSSFYAGIDSMTIASQKLVELENKQKDYEQAYDEELKKKKSDADKLSDYEDQAMEAYRQRINLVHEMTESVAGSVEDLSSKLTNAFVEAFRNGINSAREWRDTVREYMGEVLQEMLLNKMLAPELEKVYNQWLYGFQNTAEKSAEEQATDEAKKQGKDYRQYMYDRLNDEGLTIEARNSLDSLLEFITAMYENLNGTAQGLIGYNRTTSDLRSGIEGITEDTARTIEGLSNSILMQNVLQTTYLQSLNQTAIAQIQMSWFNDILMQARATRVATESINTMMDAFYSPGDRAVKVTMI